jgi:hypothetical protein
VVGNEGEEAACSCRTARAGGWLAGAQQAAACGGWVGERRLTDSHPGDAIDLQIQ